MAFLLFFLCGLAGGVLGGMGMGGGTALIPLLTIACGVAQPVAQGINLVAFLPMSALALSVHAKSGLLAGKGIWWIIAAALLFSVLFSLLAAIVPADALRSGFGVFLVVLSMFEFRSAFVSAKNTKKRKKSL